MDSKRIPVFKIEHFYASIASEHVKKYRCILHPHKHDHFLTVFCTKGTGIHEVDFEKHPIRPGSIFMISPGQTHKMTLSPDIEGYVIMHTAEFYDVYYATKRIREYPFYCASFKSPEFVLKNHDYTYAVDIFKEVLEELKSKSPLKDQALCSLVDLLYIHLSRLYPPHKNLDKSKRSSVIDLMKLEELVDKNYKNTKSPSDYAEMMNMSSKQLNRICSNSVNKTTSDIIMDKVILEAKRMLAYDVYSIEKVAGELGYFDQSYFTRLFKKRTGITPLEFMHKHKIDGNH